MLEAKITIVAPELTEAINNLAAAIGGGAKANTSLAANPTQSPSSGVAQNVQPAPNVQAGPAPMNGPTLTYPSNPAPMPAPPVQQAAPVNFPAPGIPLAQPPKYTVDQIMQAGATLMDAGKANELINLLHSFGVQAVMDLKQEQLGAFATALRELGAKI